MAFRAGFAITPVGPNALVKNDALEATVSIDYYDPRDYNPYYAGGVEVKVMGGLYLRAGIESKFIQFSDDGDDSIESGDLPDMLDKEKAHVYTTTTAFGFGL